MTFKEEVCALIERHGVWLDENVEKIAQSLDRCAMPDGGASSPLREALNIAHQITGTSGSIGYPHISAAAAELEESLSQILASGSEVISDARGDDLRAQVDRLRSLAASTSPAQSELYAKFING